MRELKNALQRAMLLCRDGLITSADLGLPAGRRPALAPRGSDPEPERADIEAALERARGVVSQAAAELGLSRQALYRRMDKLRVPLGHGVPE